MKTRIFISKHPEDCVSLVQFCNQNNLELVAESLLNFESVLFEEASEYDIVFFSSIRSAQFYLINGAQKRNLLYACVGEETNIKLKKLGIECQFVGKEAGNPQKTAEEFKIWVKNKIVFFPKSNLSLGTFSSILPQNQVKSKVVYRTKLLSKKIPQCQIYIFTSPSNLDAFLSINEIEEISKLIVWGKSTEIRAQTIGLKITYVLKNASLMELINNLPDFLLT